MEQYYGALFGFGIDILGSNVIGPTAFVLGIVGFAGRILR